MDSSHTQPQIYVVDDEAIIAEAMAAILQAQGYAVEAFTSPLEALERIRGAGHMPSLLLTDYVMPGMNGLQLADEFRQVVPKIKVIICSGNVGVEAFQGAIHAPDDFIAKPYSVAVLLNVVKGVLCGAGK